MMGFMGWAVDHAHSGDQKCVLSFSKPCLWRWVKHGSGKWAVPNKGYIFI